MNYNNRWSRFLGKAPGVFHEWVSASARSRAMAAQGRGRRKARQRSNCSGVRLDGRRWISLTRSAYGEDISPQMVEISASTNVSVRGACWAMTAMDMSKTIMNRNNRIGKVFWWNCLKELTNYIYEIDWSEWTCHEEDDGLSCLLHWKRQENYKETNTTSLNREYWNCPLWYDDNHIQQSLETWEFASVKKYPVFFSMNQHKRNRSIWGKGDKKGVIE